MSEQSDFSDCDVDPVEEEFNEAANYLQSVHNCVDQSILLKLYGLYKQSTVGKCSVQKPSFFKFQDRSKWNSWNDLGDMSKHKAMQQYVNVISEAKPEWRQQLKTNKAQKSSHWNVHSTHKIEDDDSVDDEENAILQSVKELNSTALCKYISDEPQSLKQCIDKNGLTPLHWASDRGSPEILKLLVDSKLLDVNCQDSSGQTPLHYAATCGHSDCVNILLRAGADPNIKDNEDSDCREVAYDKIILSIINSFT